MSGFWGVLLCYVLPSVLLLRATAEVRDDSWQEQLEWAVPAGWGLLLLLGIYAVLRKIGWRPLLWIVGCAAGLALWLVVDITPAPPLPELGTLRVAGDPGWEVVAWMVKDHPASRLADADEMLRRSTEVRLPSGRELWPDHVRDNREKIIEAWAADRGGREWTARLVAQPPQGIHVLKDQEPMLSFSRVRASQHVRAAYAYLIASEGNRNGAIQLLIKQQKAWSGIQRLEASLMNQMIAVVMLKDSQNACSAILDLGGVDVGMQTELSNVLETLLPAPEVCRLGILGDYHFTRSVGEDWDLGLAEAGIDMTGESLGFDSPVLKQQARVFGLRWVWLRRESSKVYLAALTEVYRLAAARDLARAEQFANEADSTWSVRNAIGTRLSGMALPAFAKISKNIWEADDRRRELISRLSPREAE